MRDRFHPSSGYHHAENRISSNTGRVHCQLPLSGWVLNRNTQIRGYEATQCHSNPRMVSYIIYKTQRQVSEGDQTRGCCQTQLSKFLPDSARTWRGLLAYIPNKLRAEQHSRIVTGPSIPKQQERDDQSVRRVHRNERNGGWRSVLKNKLPRSTDFKSFFKLSRDSTLRRFRRFTTRKKGVYSLTDCQKTERKMLLKCGPHCSALG